jgi:hypothetical protein
MKCRKAQSLMLDHLYGELGSRHEKAFHRHLQTCDSCSREFEALKATASAFSKLDMEEPPTGLSRTLSALAAAEAERRPACAGFAWYWKPALAATAVAALVVVSFLYYVPQRETTLTAQRQAPAEEPAMLAMKKAPADAVGGTASEYREKGAVNALEGAAGRGGAIVGRDESFSDSHIDRELSEEARDIASPMAPEPEQKSRALAFNAPMPASESVRSEITAPRKRMDLDKTAAAEAPYAQYGAEAKAEGEEDSSLDALYKRGISYQDDEQWKEAVSVYEQIIEKFPDSPLLADVYLSMGDCYREMGEIDDALHAYETARDRFSGQTERAQQKIDAALAQKNTETPARPAAD